MILACGMVRGDESSYRAAGGRAGHEGGSCLACPAASSPAPAWTSRPSVTPGIKIVLVSDVEVVENAAGAGMACQGRGSREQVTSGGLIVRGCQGLGEQGQCLRKGVPAGSPPGACPQAPEHMTASPVTCTCSKRSAGDRRRAISARQGTAAQAARQAVPSGQGQGRKAVNRCRSAGSASRCRNPAGTGGASGPDTSARAGQPR
jgi:hypothetical protein